MKGSLVADADKLSHLICLKNKISCLDKIINKCVVRNNIDFVERNVGILILFFKHSNNVE